MNDKITSQLLTNVPTGKSELTKLHTDKKKQFGPLVRWLKVMVAVSFFLKSSVAFPYLQVNFGESFTAWIHVKALRVFVESVLR